MTYQNQLTEIEKEIIANYDILLDIKKFEIDNSIPIELLENQKSEIPRLFKKLKRQLQSVNINSNPLTAEWWHSLSEYWKKTFLENIYKMNYDPLEIINDDPNNFRIKIETVHRKFKEYGINILLDRIWEIEDLATEKASFSIDEVLNPGGLIAHNNAFNLKPIEKLINLKSLIIRTIVSDLSPI